MIQLSHPYMITGKTIALAIQTFVSKVMSCLCFLICYQFTVGEQNLLPPKVVLIRRLFQAENRIIDAFKLWYWKRLLRVPWTARRSNQSILKEINPGCSLEGLMLKLNLQYFGYLMRRADSLEKTLMLGKIEGRRRRG